MTRARRRAGRLPALTATLLAGGGASACATAASRSLPEVDLAQARRAVQAAREAGATQRAPEALARAEGRLAQAEALALRDSRAERERAQCLAEVVAGEALCALEATQEFPPAEPAPEGAQREADSLTLRARLLGLQAEHERLERQVALLARELELAENEIIRSKARLRGSSTKAEATAAIAEARVLTQRLARRAGDPGARARVETALRRAEEQFDAENYGASIFFALRAQDTASASLEEEPARSDHAGGLTGVVRVARANLRAGPGLEHPVVGQAPQGARLEVLDAGGEWLRVRHLALEAWVHRSLVE